MAGARPEPNATTPFAHWTPEHALEAFRRAGLPIRGVEPALWPEDAPQPKSHRHALTFGGAGLADPHLLLVFDTPEALEEWRLWLARYWKARPYLSVKDNVLLLVSRELPPERAAAYHAALARLGA